MMLIYVIVFIITITGLIKILKSPLHEVKEEVVEFREDITSNIIIIYKVLSDFMKSPILLTSLLILSTSLLLSAISAQSSLSVMSMDVGRTGTYAIYIGFKDLTPLDEFSQLLNISEFRDVKFYIRYILSSKLELLVSDEVVSIYALVGVPVNYTLDGVVVSDDVLVIGGGKYVNTTLRVGNNSYMITSVNPKVVEDSRIFYEIPLLPVQAYLGTKPITVPADKVLITTTSNVIKLLHLDKYSVTDVVIGLKDGLGSYDVEVFRGLLEGYRPTIMVLKDNILEVLSSYGLPTKESLLSSLISALISSIVLSVTFIALQPKVRSVYDRLSILGFHSWSFTTLLTMFVAVVFLVLGVIMLVIINHLLGIYSTINSAITFITSYITIIIFINKKVFNLSTTEAVSVPTSTKFNLIVRGVDVCHTLEYISNLLRSDEFFELRDLDVKCDRGGFLHASCRFKGVWGIGLDLDLFVTRHGGDNLELSFNISMWSIEELSEKQLESILRLLNSKLLGGIRVWTLSQVQL